MTLKEAIKSSLIILKQVMEEKLNATNIEVLSCFPVTLQVLGLPLVKTEEIQKANLSALFLGHKSIWVIISVSEVLGARVQWG